MTEDPFLLKGKNILVTGASSGIGKATAIECSKLGANLVITGRDQVRLDNTLEELSGNGHRSLVADLTETQAISLLCDSLQDIDGCSLNAGINKPMPIQFINEEYISEVLRINTISPILLVQSLIKKKKLRKGASIVFTSSIAGVFRSSVANSIYSSTKAAINGFMKNAAFELAPRGIRVNSVNPGMVETEMLGSGIITSEQYELDRKTYPLQRYGKPEEIAYSIAFLLSDATRWITGINLVIDGGVTLR